MTEEFIVDYRLNKEFDSLLALNISVEGFGAALMAESVIMHYPMGVIVGLALVIAGIMILFLHLGNRFKFWRVIAGLKRAWISRGAFFAGGLVGLGIFSLFLNGGPLDLIVQTGIVVFGLLTILYSGFLLSSMTPIPFWNSPLTPVLFLLHSITTGMAILIFLLAQSTVKNLSIEIVGLLLGLTSVTLLFTIIHIMVMSTSSSAARESVRLLMSPARKWTFLGGAIVLGLLIPLLIYSFIYLSGGRSTEGLSTMLFVAMGLRAIGDYAFRSSLLHAGVFEILI
jgi:formate-dependent nitrite reductase membrane component NrfD